MHRDLKPANVFLSHEGTAIIADFGIAKYFSKSEVSTNKGNSTDSTMIVTAAYVPPEFWRHGYWGFKGDIWSLGVMVYELITGQYPYSTLPRYPSAQLTADVKCPAEFPSEVQSFVNRCLVLEPSDGNIQRANITELYTHPLTALP